MTKMKRARSRFQLGALAVLLVGSFASLARAQSDEELRLLREQNERQQQQIEELQRQVRALAGGDELVDEVADQVAEQVRDRILDLAINEIESQSISAALDEDGTPKWLKGLVFKGDLRVRYEGRWAEDSERFPEDRNRGRFRLRFGFEKTWGDEPDWKVAFRLATGDGVPTTTNQTFDNFFFLKNLWVDRAYVRWAPTEGFLKGLEIIGGKMPNQFLTNWVYLDADVSPEGVFEKYTVELFDGMIDVYANFGQFFVNEHARTPDDMTLLVYGGGFDTGDVVDTEQFKAAGGFACNFYDYTHVKDNSYRLGGNPVVTLGDATFNSAEDFDQLDFEGYVKGKVFDVDYRVYGNVSTNVDVDEDSPFNMPEYADQWAIGLKLGRGKKKGDLTLEGTVFKIEANSVFGFSDSDIEGVDHQGGVFRAFYNLTDFAKIGGSAFFVDRISAEEDKDHFDKLQVDLSLKF